MSIKSCQLAQSLFSIRKEIGEPRVLPNLTPLNIWTESDSIFILELLPYPDCLLLSCLSIYFFEKGILEGKPSIMVTNVLPWDSPAVRNLIIKIFLFITKYKKNARLTGRLL